MSAIFEEWSELTDDYKKLESTNLQYLNELKEISKLQQACLKHISHQRYRLSGIKESLARTPKGKLAEEDIKDINERLIKREVELQAIEQTLPKKTGLYLKIVLGDVDVSFLNKDAKFRYKDEFEKFKLICHVVAFVTVFTLWYIPFRPLEQIYLGFLLWYYCIITAREGILKANGSRIKGWWRLHHLLSAFSTGILLVWSASDIWTEFRSQFIYYSLYNCFIQYLLFKYQRGALYRLKSLGERDNMDITIEGFHSWMWRGLTFLLPFLFAGYVFQLALAVALFRLSYHPQATWHVMASSLMFLLFFVGNSSTTMMVVPNKIKEKVMFKYRVMTSRLYDAVSEKVRR